MHAQFIIQFNPKNDPYAKAGTDSNKMLKTMHMHAYLIGQSKVN